VSGTSSVMTVSTAESWPKRNATACNRNEATMPAKPSSQVVRRSRSRSTAAPNGRRTCCWKLALRCIMLASALPPAAAAAHTKLTAAPDPIPHTM